MIGRLMLRNGLIETVRLAKRWNGNLKDGEAGLGRAGLGQTTG
jgi:hypothetical protein